MEKGCTLGLSQSSLFHQECFYLLSLLPSKYYRNIENEKKALTRAISLFVRSADSLGMREYPAFRFSRTCEIRLLSNSTSESNKLAESPAKEALI